MDLFHAIFDAIHTGLLLLRSGNSHFVSSWSYAKAHMGSTNRRDFAWLHYVLLGERRGYRPNPFFDPAYAAAQNPRCSFARYLFDEEFRTIKPSAEFDPVWYERHHASQNELRHPFLDFWLEGFDKDRSPCSDFDLRFFKYVVCRDRPDKKEAAYDVLATPHHNFPKNIPQLKQRQQAFYASIKLDLISHTQTRRTKYLVFVLAGLGFDAAALRGHDTFDLWLNYYENASGVAAEADVVSSQRGTKTTAIRKILEDVPDLLLRYDAVLMLDDDVELSADDLRRLFAIWEASGLDLAQASLTSDSACYFEALKQPRAGEGTCLLTAVEIMMPLVSRRALASAKDVFAASISGWYVDVLLGRAVRRMFGQTSVGLIGDVVARHARPTDVDDGAFYRFLAAYGLNPTIEAGAIILEHELGDADMPAKLQRDVTPSIEADGHNHR